MKSLLPQAQVLSYSHSGKQSVPHVSLHCLVTLGVRARGCRGASAHTDNANMHTQDMAMRLPVQEKGNGLTYWQRS